MENHKLNWADIWVLRAIKMCTERGKYDLTEVIAIADGINHAILTSEEFNNGVYRLKEHELISQNDKALELTQSAHALFEKHQKKGIHKQGEAIEKELGVVRYGPGYNPNILEVPEEFISKGKFNNAVDQYQRQHSF